MVRCKLILLFLFAMQLWLNSVNAADAQERPKILIVYEGSDLPLNYAKGDARQLANLFGHFNTEYKLEPVQSYKSGDLNPYDFVFYVGFTKKNDPPDKFLKDIFNTTKKVIWMNTGFDRFCERYDVAGKFGFSFLRLDTVTSYNVVNSGDKTYTKDEPNLNLTVVKNSKQVEVLATAYSTVKRKTENYILRSDNFMYIGDSPFASATMTDRYILFSDMLHDILNQHHAEIHRALLRIEDVNVFDSPAKLRAIADMLYSKNIPFLVGVIPIFIDPQAGLHVTLSDKPDFVDAIHYMVSKGATIVLHGATHQYLGVTASDFEFWDDGTNKAIKNDSKDYVEKKIKMGLEECWKNNIYPLLWETPHYTASQIDYDAIGSFFSTAMEQRMVIDDPDYGQYFPYIIEKDLHGQRIIPENLGYIPLDSNQQVEEDAVQQLLTGAKAQLNVRDGFASAFIHSFIDINYIEEYVDGVTAMGYTFMNMRQEPAWVRLKDKVIVSGKETYSITLEDQYLRETWLKQDGQIDHEIISPERIHGAFQKTIQLYDGQVYLAEPSEYRERELTFMDQVTGEWKSFWQNMTHHEENFSEARVAVRWDPKATGGAFNDQASFVSAFRSLNIPVDTLDDDTLESLEDYNLVVIPYNTVDRLPNKDYDRLIGFVEKGGNIITDGKNDFAQELGIKFANSTLRIERMRDQQHLEDPLVPLVSETMNRFEVETNDEVLCTDERTEAPVVIERARGKGRFLYFGLRFDPYSTEGYSRFPYLMEYVQKYFNLLPILRRDRLEVYFEPGSRRNISIEDLVKRWVSDGIRIVHAASWHEYPTYTYQYKRLIDLCHANGILVYAWLEPPMVSQKFWKEHPEWQEVNYKGERIPANWRYVVSLTAPACLAAVKDFYKDFLSAYDWDGANIAELHFESGGGPNDPKTLNPMHPSARAEFKKKHGFDPALLLDTASSYYWRNNSYAWKQYEEYRVESIVRFHDELLNTIDSVKIAKPFLDVIVTTFDNITTPALRTNLGVDVRRILALSRRHKFSLQIEDPQTQWSKDPNRYQGIGKLYSTMVGDSVPLMLDLNILQFRTETTPTPFPTIIQTGTESFQLIHSASLGADRFTIYSESSVRPRDLKMFAFAASGPAYYDQTEDGWSVDSPFPPTLQLPPQFIGVRLSTGATYYCENGKVLLPPGKYEVTPIKLGNTPFGQPLVAGKLLSITGNLKELVVSSRSVAFKYESKERCLASFNHPPYAIIIDEKETDIKSQPGYERFSVILPPGEHAVIAVLQTTVSYGVDITSFWSSWVIVIFGAVSGTVLISFYTIVRLSRGGAKR
jgi:uncharacterized protein YdaL